VENVLFKLDFADGGDLSKIIKDLQTIDKLTDKIGSAKPLSKTIDQFNQLDQKVGEVQKKLSASTNVKEITTLTGEIGKLRTEYDNLQKEINEVNKARKESKAITDEELKQRITEQESLNKRKKSIRELIKDEQALEIATKKEVKSLVDLQDKTNALIRVRSKLDLSNKSQKKQFDDLTLEINKNNAALLQHDKAIGRSQRNVGNYQSAFKGLGGGFIRTAALLGGVTLGVTAVGSAIGGSIRDFQEFDKALKDVSAITGLAGQDLEFFKTKALEAGQNSQTGAKQYLEAVKLIGSATPSLLKDKNALAAVTNEALVLAEASGIDLPTAAAALTSSLNQFELSAKDSKRVINTLAAGSKEGAAEVFDLAEAFKNVGTIAKQSNFTFEQTVAALEVLAEKQLKGAEAGTKLRGAVSQLQKAGLGFASGQFKINDALKDAEKLLNGIKDPAAKARKEIQLFGIENRVAGTILLNNQDRFKELTKAVTGTNTAYEQMAIQNKSAAAEAQRLANKAEVLRIKLGEKLAPAVNRLKLGFYQLAEALLAPVTGEIIDKYEQISQLVNNMFTDQKALTSKLMENAGINLSQLSGIELFEAKKRLDDLKIAAGQLNEELKNSTDLTKKEGKELIDQYNSGKITFDKFRESTAKLIKLEIERRKNGTGDIKQTKDLTKATEELGGATGNLGKGGKTFEQANKDRFDMSMKLLEDEKTQRLIDIENTITDEKQKQIALLELEIEFSNRKINIQQEFKQATLQTRLDILKQEDALMKQENTNRKEDLKRAEEILNLQDQLEIENMENDRDREEAQAQFDFEQDIKRLEDEGKLTGDIEKEMIEKLMKEISEIRKKYGEGMAEEFEGVLAGMTASATKATEDINEDQIKKLEDLRRHVRIAQDAITDALDRAIEARIDRDQEAVDTANENVSIQEQRAISGLENTLAFEKQIAADRQRQLLEDQRKQEKIKKLETYFDLLAAYADKDPDNAPAKALITLQIGEAIAARLEKGGVVIDEVEKQNKGILKGPSHRQGGILIEAEGSEGFFNKKEMHNLGKDNFYAIKDALKYPVHGKVMQKQNESLLPLIVKPESKISFEPLEKAINRVEGAVQNIPKTTFIIDKDANLITKTETKILVHTLIQKKKGFNN